MARLPWIQLGAAFDLAPRLKGLLGVSGLEALGLLAMLDRVAVELVDGDGRPYGLFPGDRGHLQLAGAVGWPGDAAGLVQALAEVGKVEVGPAGVRVLGMEWAVKAAIAQEDSARRRAAWKERQAAERVPNASRTRPERVPNGDEKETQTETQKEKETLGSVDLPPAGAAGIPLPADSSDRKEGLLAEPFGPAGELDLDFQIAPGAKVAARTVKTRAKKPNAGEEATSAPTGSFRRQLTDALDAAFLRATGERYDWQADKRNFGAEGLGSNEKPGALMKLVERHGIPGVAATFELGVREFYREHAPSGRRVAHPWQLPRAWAALVDARPTEPAAPREPAWMAGEVGERWRQARDGSGQTYNLDQVAKLVTAAALDVDVLRLWVEYDYQVAWIQGNHGDLLREWLGPVKIEVQPGGGE